MYAIFTSIGEECRLWEMAFPEFDDAELWVINHLHTPELTGIEEIQIIDMNVVASQGLDDAVVSSKLLDEEGFIVSELTVSPELVKRDNTIIP
jgi:hypothetical protein